MKYYAVRKGRIPGIYRSWNECKEQTFGFSGPEFKSFISITLAEKFMNSKKEEKKKKSPQKKNKKERRIYYLKPKRLLSSTSIDEKNIPIVYTDGSAILRVNAGAGVFFGNGDNRNGSYRVPGEQTNQRAEAYAVIKALQSCEGPIRIITDSMYVINCLTGIWSINANKDLFGVLQQEVGNRYIILEWVKGHSGIRGNEEADRLANEGRLIDT
jgi:ribonuclease HI